MRKFTRSEPPQAWSDNEARWNQQWVELLKSNPKATFSWYKQDGKTARDIALPHLKAQTVEHCSFCDGFPIEDLSLETIEHFRPKYAAGFPQNAYSWANLYYCCSACQSHKRENWDQELIAPDEQMYEFHRFFEFDFTTGAIRPATTAGEADKRRAEVTISTYGLDTAGRRRWRRIQLNLWAAAKSANGKLDEFPYRDYLEIGLPDGAAADF